MDERPPNMDLEVLKLIRRGRRIPASSLFTDEGKPTLHELCTVLSSTARGKPYDGWPEFASRLKITKEQIDIIEYDLKGRECSTNNVLQSYVQRETATLAGIMEALLEMKSRPDIILRISDCMKSLIDEIEFDSESKILRRSIPPRVPLVLMPKETIRYKRKNTIAITHEALQQSAPRQLTQPKQKIEYAKIVMLTFAEDGEKTAYDFARECRSQQPPIGVVVLQEQRQHVYQKNRRFVEDCVRQADCVVPIITRGYIKRIRNAMSKTSSDESLDSKYVLYIYELLMNEFMNNRLRNYRIRCIVPDGEINTVLKHNIYPPLQAWFPEREIEKFISKILLNKY